MEKLLEEILHILYDLKNMIYDLYQISNDELNEKKSCNFDKKILDIYFDKYRQAKFLIESYMDFIKNFIFNTELYLTNKKIENYELSIKNLSKIIKINITKNLPNNFKPIIGELNEKYSIFIYEFTD